jgi:hypothetical protein
MFPPLANKETSFPYFEVPDEIFAHLTGEGGGNVHDRRIAEITSGSFEKEIQGANSHSVAYDKDPIYAAKNAADLESDSISCQLVAKAKRMFRTRGTIGGASISRRGGLCQRITHSAKTALTIFI